MHEETATRPMSVPSSVAATTTQSTATDHNSAELQVSYSSSSADSCLLTGAIDYAGGSVSSDDCKADVDEDPLKFNSADRKILHAISGRGRFFVMDGESSSAAEVTSGLLQDLTPACVSENACLSASSSNTVLALLPTHNRGC
ncbi:uncharacterized protein LOC126187399 [Schistocerca cancellata]|uniref:uncharacterized protein LOC126187399 n=1 Tax=Schistocerca cancellata TaxID=274614 RepID=UPI00211862C1|nr:uncharacterized protein LOC126187399 [Schistocerca cancellata]